MSARGIVVDYKSGAAPSAKQIHDEARLQIPLYLLVLRDQLGLEPMGGVYMPLGGGRRARGMLRAGEDQVLGFDAGDYLDGPEFEAEIEHARGVGGRAGRAHPRGRRRSTTRAAATARPGATSGASAARSAREHARNPQQQAAIDARGSTFVSAGAGTGKTTVLVERFARAVIDDGLDVDSLLVITYTDRAAGELRAQDPGATARARAARSGARPRRRLDLDDPRLLPPAPDGVPARGRHRPAVPRARRVAGARAAGRGVQRRPGRVLRRRRARPLAAARDLQGGRASARCSSASTTRCARPAAS